MGWIQASFIRVGQIMATDKKPKETYEDEELFGRLLELVKLELNKIYGAGGICV